MNFFKNLFCKKNSCLLTKNNIIILLLIMLFTVIFVRENTLQWVLLNLALFSTMGNDSVQTLGTFFISNRKIKWWIPCIYIAVLFIMTIAIGWFTYYHQIHFDRLETIQYASYITPFHILAPIVLLVLTYYGIPVSTTFLILSVFATGSTIESMLTKTFLGYIVAFGLSVFQWYFLNKYFQPILVGDSSGSRLIRWQILKWFATGLLWVAWLMQNTANFAVYIPRELSLYNLFIFLILGVMTIIFIFYNKGGPIQEIVNEKQDIVNIRSATLIDLSFAFIILIFKEISTIPMATTWVFIGLLGGREFILAYAKNDANNERYKKAIQIIFKDLTLATIGIVLSLIVVGLSKI